MATGNINIVTRLQRWMDSIPGQTFLNYAYSWGASIVILGALFKLTHLYGADLMLFIGMGTEVVVFFLSAFDRPFTRDDASLDLHEEGEDTDENQEGKTEETAETATNAGGATVIIGGGIPAGEGNIPAGAAAMTEGGIQGIAGGIPAGNIPGGPIVVGTGAAAMTDAQNAANPELEDVTKNYVEKLKNLTEVLAKVEEQSRKMTTDSEEMINLNRTLTGINTVYELQLKNISSQIGTIDQINEQTRRMAKQIEELNGVYSRMIKALTVNMKNAAAASSASADAD